MPRNVSGRSLYISYLGLCALPFLANGATVTVDPSATVVPGAVYNTLNEATLNLIGGDIWGDGDDTVLLVTNQKHYVTEDVPMKVLDLDPTNSLTIKSEGPGPATVVGDADFTRFRLFELEDSGIYTVEDLMIVGGAGKNGDDSTFGYEYRAAFKVEPDAPGTEMTLFIRNCVVTANDGTDNPILDYTGTFPANNEGAFMRGIFSGDNSYRGRVSCTVENCVFAYLIGQPGNDKGGGMHFFRRIDASNPLGVSATQEFTFRNCLIANSLSDAVTIGGATRVSSITFEDCLIAKTVGRGIWLTLLPDIGDGPGEDWGGPTVLLKHAIIDSASEAIANFSFPFTGLLQIDEATIQSPGWDAIYLTDQLDATGTYRLSDVIAFGVNSLFRLGPDPNSDSGPPPFELLASSLATDSAVLGTQDTTVQSELNDAVVTSEDPLFVTTDPGFALSSVRNWDSLNNTLFDVDNGTYAGLGTISPDLRGGADFQLPPPVPQSHALWHLYE